MIRFLLLALLLVASCTRVSEAIPILVPIDSVVIDVNFAFPACDSISVASRMDSVGMAVVNQDMFLSVRCVYKITKFCVGPLFLGPYQNFTSLRRQSGLVFQPFLFNYFLGFYPSGFT